MFLHKLDVCSTLVVPQDYHLILAGQFAALWGNERFDAADPWAKYMARNHDAGWIEHDREPGIDRSTGLPWNIVDMHPEDLNPIHRRSIDRNARYGRYAGILSCMHTMGFYNSRMGQSDFAVMDDYAHKYSDVVHPMVTECTAQIEKWKAELVDQGQSPDQLEARLWRSYRLLEAFDTMSIYFCLRPKATLEPHTFPNVPERDSKLTPIRFTPHEGDDIEVDPYPFAVQPMTIYLHGRVIDRPLKSGAATALADAPAVDVVYRLTAD